MKKIFRFYRALLAVLFYGYPARNLKVVGVTGTDGKTTTVSLVYHILKSLGKKVSMISTLKAVIGGEEIKTGLHITTPDPFKLQKLLRRARKRGSEYVVLEVSSHGLDQFRVMGCNFLIGVLTNVTPEHTDYHGGFEKYLEAKVKLFLKSKTAVLSEEDENFEKIMGIIKSSGKGVKAVSYPRLKKGSRLKEKVEKEFKEPYNRLNAEAAIAAVKELGVKDSEILKALGDFPGVEGRMQKVANKKGIKIFIDFAHTPNGLKNVLEALKDKKGNGRLVCVIGSAGERDREKREKLGQIAATYADVSVFTAEDPRNEDVNKIIEVLVKGAKKKGAKRLLSEESGKKGSYYIDIAERGEAISLAIQKIAQKGDTVAVCGKGPEESMAYGNKEYPWSDYDAVKKALEGKVKRIERFGNGEN